MGIGLWGTGCRPSVSITKMESWASIVRSGWNGLRIGTGRLDRTDGRVGSWSSLPLSGFISMGGSLPSTRTRMGFHLVAGYARSGGDIRVGVCRRGSCVSLNRFRNGAGRGQGLRDRAARRSAFAESRGLPGVGGDTRAARSTGLPQATSPARTGRCLWGSWCIGVGVWADLSRRGPSLREAGLDRSPRRGHRHRGRSSRRRSRRCPRQRRGGRGRQPRRLRSG